MKNILRLIHSNSFTLILEKLIKLILSVVVVSMMARDFGVSAFGAFNTQIAICTLFIPLASLGLNKLVLKKIADVNNIAKAQEILSTAVLTRFIAGLLISFFSLLLFQNYALSFFLFAQSFLALQLCEAVLQYEGDFKFVSNSRLLITLFFTIIKIIALKASPTVNVMLIVFAVEILVVETLLLIAFRFRSSYRLFFYFNFTLMKSLIKSSVLLMLSGIIATVYLKLDIVMLQYFGSSHEAGIYSAAARISEAWVFIPAILLARFFPMLLSLQKTNLVLYKKSLQYLMDKTFLLGGVLVIIVCTLAPIIIMSLYGHSFYESILILQLHSIATLFISMRLLVSQWLVMNEGYMLSLLSHLAGAVVNIVLNYLLINEYGALGATISTIIAYLISSYLCFFLTKKGKEIRQSMSRSIFFFYRYKSFFNMKMPWKFR